jgi:hypothetical protein
VTEQNPTATAKQIDQQAVEVTRPGPTDKQWACIYETGDREYQVVLTPIEEVAFDIATGLMIDKGIMPRIKPTSERAFRSSVALAGAAVSDPCLKHADFVHYTVNYPKPGPYSKSLLVVMPSPDDALLYQFDTEDEAVQKGDQIKGRLSDAPVFVVPNFHPDNLTKFLELSGSQAAQVRPGMWTVSRIPSPPT